MKALFIALCSTTKVSQKEMSNPLPDSSLQIERDVHVLSAVQFPLPSCVAGKVVSSAGEKVVFGGGFAVDRRSFLAASAIAGGAIVAKSTNAASRDWSGSSPIHYPDPDILVLDPRFEKYKLGNAAIERIHTGNSWVEGVAWNHQGRYLVWSDIPNNLQRRWLEDDGHVSVFRAHSGYSNGNTFDLQGRQISFEHGERRVVRYEHDGTVTVLADGWQGKPLNAPNDGVIHPDGSLWFTDPGYGSMTDYEGAKRPLEQKEAVYRLDLKTGQMTKVTDEIVKPNGLCFSPDYKKLYVVDTGGGVPKPIYLWDVEGARLRNRRTFCTMRYDGRNGASDGIRADEEGNIWAAAGWAGNGFDGVHIFAPDGDRIGVILLPEICANLCFGGPKRNRLFMAASQSIYAVYVNTCGAHLA